MSSFYGGKQGRTYHIVQRYNSVQLMCEAFAGGGAYTLANYGLYVIIDTVLESGRSNLENGLLYRRGFDYNDSASQYIKPNPEDSKYQNPQTGFDKQVYQLDWAEWVQHPGNGAIYVGQIVGPEGRSPEIEIEKWSDFENLIANTRNEIEIDLTPGKVNLSTFNDVIKAGYVNIRDLHGDIGSAKIAFDIPYTVIEAEVVDTNPYLTSTVYEDPISTAHPFYYKWDFKIPKGVHGQDLTAVVKLNGSNIDNSSVDGLGNPIVADDEYLTYTITNYNSGQPGDSDAAAAASTAHLGRWPYRVINEIYSIVKIRGNLITPEKWEENDYIPLIGQLYREDGYDEDIYWVCVKSGRRTSANDKPKGENATLTNLGFEDSSLGNCVWRVVKIPQTTPIHSLNIDYKAGPSSTVSGLRNVDYLTVDKNGKMYVFYSNSDEPFYLTTLHSIENLYYDSLNGVVRIKYYGQEEEDLYNPKVIKRVSYNTGLLQPQEYQVHYDDGTFDTVSERTNVIAATRRLGDNLLFLYSDPDMRDAIPSDKRVTFDLVWTDALTGSTYAPNSLVWYNFGPLGAQYHMQGIYSYSDLIEGGQLEHGFDNIAGLEDRAGWLVTVITQLEVDGQTINVPHIYAYDYTEGTSTPTHTIPDGQGGTTTSHWYEVMSLTAASLNPNMFVAASTSQPETLSSNGLWFVVSYGHDQEVSNG